MVDETQYRAITGCYGATRGTTVAAIANEVVRTMTRGAMKAGNLEIVVEGVGAPDPKFMPDNKVNHPVRQEWLEAIMETSKDYNGAIDADRVEIHTELKQVAFFQHVNL
jgi:hypothetical protein